MLADDWLLKEKVVNDTETPVIHLIANRVARTQESQEPEEPETGQSGEIDVASLLLNVLSENAQIR